MIIFPRRRAWYSSMKNRILFRQSITSIMIQGAIWLTKEREGNTKRLSNYFVSLCLWRSHLRKICWKRRVKLHRSLIKFLYKNRIKKAKNFWDFFGGILSFSRSKSKETKLKKSQKKEFGRGNTMDYQNRKKQIVMSTNSKAEDLLRLKI